MIRRHAITILILHGGDGSPALVPPDVHWYPFVWELGGHCIHDRFLHAPDAISVHDGSSPSERRNRALRPGAEDSTSRATAGPKDQLRGITQSEYMLSGAI